MGDLIEHEVMKSAVLSPCGSYRYLLTREWNENRAACGFVMLNPSTADAEEDDPTIRRCMGYARSWGYGSLLVANVAALRSTDPRALFAHPDPIGPENEAALRKLAIRCSRIVVAWGVHAARLPGRAHARALVAIRGARQPGWEHVQALRITKGGHPSHPLYLPADAVLRPYGQVPS